MTSQCYKHEIKGQDFFPLMGDAIAAGSKTGGEIAIELVNQGFSYLTVMEYLQLLFDRGFLADELDQRN